MIKTNEKIAVNMNYFGKYNVVANKVLYLTRFGRKKIKHNGKEYFVSESRIENVYTVIGE